MIGTAGDLAVREGAVDEAIHLYQEGERLALDIWNEVFLTQYLLSMSPIAVIKGLRERALILAGPADALRESTGVPWDRPSGSSQLDDLVTLAGRDLPQELISARFEEGRALSYKQAVALAPL